MSRETRARLRRWRKRAVYTRAARAFLGAHPLCQDCTKAGIRRASEQVDHVTPARLLPDFAAFMDPRNWAALCLTCHRRKTRQEIGRRPKQRPKDIQDWLDWMASGYADDFEAAAGGPDGGSPAPEDPEARSQPDLASLPSFPAIDPDSAGRD
ncbi:MAG: HNH endonuclease [Cenarchaeum sp. SB0669_bin_11]|nr:HNH endonuclease [Cenarchaeum sp. SB0669_bin_11]